MISILLQTLHIVLQRQHPLIHLLVHIPRQEQNLCNSPLIPLLLFLKSLQNGIYAPETVIECPCAIENRAEKVVLFYEKVGHRVFIDSFSDKGLGPGHTVIVFFSLMSFSEHEFLC